ncbi:unnamed protein product [Nesidiocoris tenuis]|uniref:Uncharacterized protein n=1 Tax=Nesidiocoris tenuis TaxID=355587 RepID=A0A6H5FW64_9HEMI|nr:unnamed protein product [Nesidiocoris tenuis]
MSQTQNVNTSRTTTSTATASPLANNNNNINNSQMTTPTAKRVSFQDPTPPPPPSNPAPPLDNIHEDPNICGSWAILKICIIKERLYMRLQNFKNAKNNNQVASLLYCKMSARRFSVDGSAAFATAARTFKAARRLAVQCALARLQFRHFVFLALGEGGSGGFVFFTFAFVFRHDAFGGIASWSAAGHAEFLADLVRG